MPNFALALLSAVLLILVFPQFDQVWLAPAALAPLLVAVARERNPWRRFLLGEAAGIVYWFGICYWIQFVLAYHGGMGEVAGWAVFLLFCLAKAIHLGVFTWLAGLFADRWWAVPAWAALWTGLERTHGPLGFAWLTLGNAGVNMSLPMRLAPWTGVYGLSFVFALLGAGLAVAFLGRRRELVWLAVLPVLFLLPGLPERAPGSESLVAVQPNIAMDEQWSGRLIEDTLDELAFFSTQSALTPGQPQTNLIVWPESPAPFYYEDDPRFRSVAESLTQTTQTYFLFGTVAYTEEGQPLNSAQLLSPDGRPVFRYDKIFLVPFGEFVPPLFGFVNRITSESGDFVPGEHLEVADVGGHKVGVFICYESVFPHLVRRFADAGAEVLINISNDGYFGRSAARLQHLLIARMRAAENRRWLVRVTNNGYTVSVDPAGRLRQALPPDTIAAGRLDYSYQTETTFYTRYGDWFAWLCLAAGIVAALGSQVPRYRPPD